MDNEREVTLIEDSLEIKNIIETKIKNKNIILTDWYKLGILKKGIYEV